MLTGASTGLVIAGAQKSASTSMAELLGRHPGVAMVNREVMALEDPYYPEGVEWLREHVAASHARGLVPALKRPELLHRRETPERVLEVLPGSFVVVILREPIARTLSAYYHYVRHGLLPAVDPNAGISRLLDDLEGQAPSAPGHQVVKYSFYADAVERMLETLGERVGVIYQEDLITRTASCAEEVLNAVGLDPHDLGPLPRANSGTYNLHRYRPARIGGRLGYEIEEDGSFMVTGRSSRLALAKGLFALDRCVYRSVGAPRALRSELRDRLASTFAADARRLPDLIGRPLPAKWSTRC